MGNIFSSGKKIEQKTSSSSSASSSLVSSTSTTTNTKSSTNTKNEMVITVSAFLSILNSKDTTDDLELANWLLNSLAKWLLTDLCHMVVDYFDYWSFFYATRERIYTCQSVTLNPSLLFNKIKGYYYFSAQFALQGMANEVIGIFKTLSDKEAKALAKTSIQATDFHGRRAEGTLLALAGMGGSVNPLKEMKKNYGAVEQLYSYFVFVKKCISKEEAVAQLAKVFGKGWGEQTNKRMAPYIKAYETLGEDIIAGNTDAVKNFQATLKEIATSQEVTTTGFIYDGVELIEKCTQYLIAKIPLFGGWSNGKTDLFAVTAIGSLQNMLSDEDYRLVVGYGIKHVDKYFAYPKSLRRLDGLGDSFFVDILGQQRRDGMDCLAFGAREALDKFISNKQQAMACFFATLRQPTNTTSMQLNHRQSGLCQRI